jgi:16S rRNA processing protein RimM
VTSGGPPGQRRWISVGRVGRAHGLAGHVVVEDASDDPVRFAPGARVYVDREPATVVESKRASGRPVVRLDRPVTRGALLELPAEELPELPEGELYAYQLEGLRVELEDGRPLGSVARVSPGVANDVLELDNGVLLPLVEDCVRAVDLEAGRIVIAPEFAEPA